MNAYGDAPAGKTGTIRLVRAELADGTVGLGVEGYDRIDEQTIAGLKKHVIGTDPMSMYTWNGDRIQSVAPDYQDILLDSQFAWFESCLLDLVGRLNQTPVPALFGSPVRDGVDAYDGTLYFKDVEQETGPEIIGELAARIHDDGYQALKMKVGRPNKWMDTKEGLQRDIEAVLAARNAVGNNVNIMADANNGYEGQVRLGLRFLQAVNPQDLYWIEELVPETQQIYSQLRQTMFSEGMDIRTADGENAMWADEASIQQPSDVQTWVENNHFDVVQPDLRSVGFNNALRMADVASQFGATLVPHNWQSELGKCMGVHLARLRDNIRFVEDDRWSNHALDTSGYQFREGQWHTPEAPGWGIRLSDHYDRFAKIEEEQVIS
jgi:L-alanine-DL-glutamate epimerase-like enolase superfamily enzyme